MTIEELRNQQESLMEMQNQLTMGEMKVQRQLEKSKELQLTQEEAAALEARSSASGTSFPSKTAARKSR